MSRLRLAIYLDSSLNRSDANKTIGLIDALIGSLRPLIASVDKTGIEP